MYIRHVVEFTQCRKITYDIKEKLVILYLIYPAPFKKKVRPLKIPLDLTLSIDKLTSHVQKRRYEQ